MCTHQCDLAHVMRHGDAALRRLAQLLQRRLRALRRERVPGGVTTIVTTFVTGLLYGADYDPRIKAVAVLSA